MLWNVIPCSFMCSDQCVGGACFKRILLMPETLITFHQSTGCHTLGDFIDAAMGMPALACKF
jgi:hypothetical protein